MVMDEEAVVSAAAELVPQYRARNPGADELVLVLPRWMWNQFGQERLTASFKRLGVRHVELVGDWTESVASKPQMLLYAAGTWHTNHHIGQTNPDCEGCRHAS